MTQQSYSNKNANQVYAIITGRPFEMDLSRLIRYSTTTPNPRNDITALIKRMKKELNDLLIEYKIQPISED